MRPDLLAISPASARYADLHRLTLRNHGVPIGSRLWRVRGHTGRDDANNDVANAVSVDDLLQPLLRASTLGGLLEQLRGDFWHEIDETLPWTLRFEEHGNPNVKAPARVHECLCSVARYMPGPPALLPGTRRNATRDCVLLRSRRLWYLAEAVRDPRRQRPREAASHWASRVYTFSAATDIRLAQLALSLALHARHAAAATRVCGNSDDPPTLPPVVLDPCCGSGTVLFAAALRGLPSIGCDLNPLAVRGATANLGDAARRFEWTPDLMPVVLDHDARSAVQHESMQKVGIVLASLPWGRQQRLEHHFHIRDLLQGVARQVPRHTTFALLSAESIAPTLATCGLTLHTEAPVGTRCVLSISSLEAKPQQPPVREGEASPLVEPPIGPLELLSGGGMRCGSGQRSDGDDGPASGGTIALQCRAGDRGRLWVRAQVERVEPAEESESGEWVCELKWDEAGVGEQQQHGLPTRVSLARHAGPNWRVE